MIKKALLLACGAALAAGAHAAAQRLPTWDDAGARFAAVLAAVAP